MYQKFVEKQNAIECAKMVAFQQRTVTEVVCDRYPHNAHVVYKVMPYNARLTRWEHLIADDATDLPACYDACGKHPYAD